MLPYLTEFYNCGSDGRLSIENADEIFFVNSGKVIPAGSLNDAVNLLMHGKTD